MKVKVVFLKLAKCYNSAVMIRHIVILIVVFMIIPVDGSSDYISDYRNKCNELIVAAKSLDDEQRLWQLFDANWKYKMIASPESATWRGYPGQNHRWSDLSLEALNTGKEVDKLTLKTVLSVNRSKLSAANQLNYDLFRRNAEMAVERQRFPGQYLVINQMEGLPRDVPSMIEMMPRSNIGDYEAILSRLSGVPKLVDQTIVLLQEGMARGIVPPKIPLRTLSDQVAGQIQAEAFASPMLSHFKSFPETISSNEQARLKKTAETVYLSEVKPAMNRLHVYLRDEYVPNCRDTVGRSALQNGLKWYDYMIRHYTTMSLSPDEIHEIGLNEVKRIREEMEAIKKQVGFNEDLGRFFELLRTDSRFYYNTADELLAGYRDICKRADPELIKLFSKLPRQPYGIVPIPAYIEKSVTTAYYQPGSNEAGRAGFFFANTYDLKSRPKWEMEALALHEAVPGHHLQLAIADEIEGLPEFRKYGRYTGYVEGWGLYSESLGEEMGFYIDPYSKFGQLTYEIWRAIRLVVDTGIHAKGWSRKQAIDFFKANAGKAEHDIVVEVDRYIVWPGQALAYKLGELKIKQLRARASSKLGDNFDIRLFHDEILWNGALPLSILEKRIDNWIIGQER
ncbi:MAG: DUF885 domain-containing protein [Verrucomicrobiota bacterium]|jgi:uncharacterized protein (DUF885 family)|nr:DUF885 domain-containing protein [Verrucomicrobiota bacterium]